MACCTVGDRPDCHLIDEQIVAGTSFRQMSRTFGIPKDTIGRHARAHVAAFRDVQAKRTKDGARKRLGRKLATAAVELSPIESPDDVVRDYQWARLEARNLFEDAKARGDWKSAERQFDRILESIDRFAKVYGMFAPEGGVNVTVDARTIRIDPSVSEELMRAVVDAHRAGRPLPALPQSVIIEATP